MSAEMKYPYDEEVKGMETTARCMPIWVEAWLFISGVICALDVTFTMGRPHTTKGGFLEYPYYGWNLYSDVDIRYATENDIVTCATGRVMIIEIILNFIAVLMARKHSRHACLTAFMTSCFVFWKTVWFLVLYISPPEGNPSYFTEHSDYFRIFIIFWVPNGVWVVVPFFAMVALWNNLALPPELARNYNRGEIQVSLDERIYMKQRERA